MTTYICKLYCIATTMMQAKSNKCANNFEMISFVILECIRYRHMRSFEFDSRQSETEQRGRRENMCVCLIILKDFLITGQEIEFSNMENEERNYFQIFKLNCKKVKFSVPVLCYKISHFFLSILYYKKKKKIPNRLATCCVRKTMSNQNLLQMVENLMDNNQKQFRRTDVRLLQNM